VTQLIKYERIETTLPKAKLLKRFADKMVTLGKKGTKVHYGQACSFVRDRKMVDKLFNEFADRYRHRDGGYTRVMRTRKRTGDNAQMAFIEYIDREGEIRKPLPPKSEAEKQEILRKFLETQGVLASKPEEKIVEMTEEELAHAENFLGEEATEEKKE